MSVLKYATDSARFWGSLRYARSTGKTAGYMARLDTCRFRGIRNPRL